MSISLDKLNPKFRQLTDLLFYSDRMDLDLSNYKQLLKESLEHFEYAWDRFQKSTEIFWEDGEQFWFNRFSSLLALNDKNLSKHIENYLEHRMFNLVRGSKKIDIKYNIEYLQFVEYCKAKHARKESLLHVKMYLLDMSANIGVDKLVTIINSFTPFLFKDLSEYTEAISRKITQSSRSFELLLALEARGMKFDRKPIVNLAKEILIARAHNDKNRRAFFAIINDPEALSLLKQSYDYTYKEKLLDLLEDCDFRMIEDHHLRNFQNIVALDSSIADEFAVIYADALYSRGTGHKKANADRLIRLLKTIPQVAPKKILAYLSSHNKMSDIKYILLSFPDLKKLAAFV